MTNYYFAARYEQHPEMRKYRHQLQNTIPGATVTSRWIDCHGGTDVAAFDENTLNNDPAKCWQHAVADLEDLDVADVLVSFTGGGGRGGRHVEYGFAIANRLRLVIIGTREHVFHCDPAAEVYPTWEEFLAAENQDGDQP